MPQVFQRILLATERTEFDVGAERLALAMALRCGQPLAVVMPLVSNPEYEAVAPALAERSDRDAASRLARFRELARGSGVEIELRVRRGAEADREIVGEARERNADLIVIRRRGRRSFLAQLMVGEMVGKVLAQAPCSVLVVPRDAGMWSQRVLLAAEPGDQGRWLLELATAVASECALPLTIVCVTDKTAAKREQAEAFVAEALKNAALAGVLADGEVLAGTPASQILDSARRHAADLIIMGVRSSGRFERALFGGVAQQVTGLSSSAVLLAQPLPTNKDVSP